MYTSALLVTLKVKNASSALSAGLHVPGAEATSNTAPAVMSLTVGLPVYAIGAARLTGSAFSNASPRRFHSQNFGLVVVQLLSFQTPDALAVVSAQSSLPPASFGSPVFQLLNWPLISEPVE